MYECAVLDESFTAAGCHAASPGEDLGLFRADTLNEIQ